MADDLPASLPEPVRQQLGQLYRLIHTEAHGSATHAILLLQVVHDAVAAQAREIQNLPERHPR